MTGEKVPSRGLSWNCTLEISTLQCYCSLISIRVTWGKNYKYYPPKRQNRLWDLPSLLFKGIGALSPMVQRRGMQMTTQHHLVPPWRNSTPSWRAEGQLYFPALHISKTTLIKQETIKKYPIFCVSRTPNFRFKSRKRKKIFWTIMQVRNGIKL